MHITKDETYADDTVIELQNTKKSLQMIARVLRKFKSDIDTLSVCVDFECKRINAVINSQEVDNNNNTR